MLQRLTVRNYRGLHDLTIKDLGRINVFTGQNNAGKTSLLEALWLLCGAANARTAANSYVIRDRDRGKPPASWAETYWRPLFWHLDTGQNVRIAGYHSAVGDMELTVGWGRSLTTEVPRNERTDKLTEANSAEPSLKFTYVDQQSGTIQSEARETPEKFKFEQADNYIPFPSVILQPGAGNVNEDAIALGKLRTRKKGDKLLEALRVVEPKLSSVEDSSSSGAPMIWVDVGLPELVPLPVMGAGMTHVARLVLAAASVQGGVMLADEIENGLHHSVLPDVWRVVERVAQQFNVQVFVTTHSFECLEAALEAIGPDGFRLYRLEADDGVNRCVPYSPAAIGAAVRHNIEVR